MNKYTGVEIAIIGMAGQFPGADNLNEFWDNLKNGVESISVFTAEELIAAGVEESLVGNPQYVKANSFIGNKEYFDADFFGYIPSEAELMDPQIRLFHENCWKALEDSGYIPDSSQKIGLFAGATSNVNWLCYSILSNMENVVNSFTAYLLRDVNFLSSRVSHSLNLQGPSIYINTACSTSLAAVQKACMSLLLRECKLALAGGITIKNHSKAGYMYEEGMIVSHDGHCRAFDSDADGTVSAEGVGVVVLKRLEDAVSDGDNIYAIIRGSGINNDGNRKLAYTAPSIDGQSQVILKAIQMAKIQPESISYVETHGTATNLGDPIEIEALNQAFGKTKDKYCALGSVKTNIGHADTAAGVAGLIKTVLALKHRQIPPSLHFKKANPKINFTDSPFYINTGLKEWRSDKYPLRAGVSSFGIGGTNVHLILEEAPGLPASSESRDHQLLVFSAKTPGALKRYIDKFRAHLQTNKDITLSDAAYSLQVGRTPFQYRQALVCKNINEAIELLEKTETNETNAYISGKNKAAIVFMFSGQGSQYVNMCCDLYEREDVFKEQVDKCLTIVKAKSKKDLRPIFLATPGSELANKMHETEFTQPLLFIMEYALSQLLIKWGISPAIMIGHSVGEYVAACLSGVFSLEDALLLVLKRGELMQKVNRGSMLSISISEDAIKPFLEDNEDISLAAINSSELCVVSGKETSVESFKSTMEAAGYGCRIIKTSHAFHSYMMDEVLTEFETEVSRVKMNPQQIPFISNLTGKPAVDTEISQAAYWVKHLRQTVKFSEGIETIFKKGPAVFIEVGPGRVLSSLVRSNKSRQTGHAVINLVKHSEAAGSDVYYLLSGLGKIWVNGIIPDWNAFYAREKRRRVSLPTYSFERIEYPVHVDAFKMIAGMHPNKLLAKYDDLSNWFYVPTWKKTVLMPSKGPIKAARINLIFVDDCGVGDALANKLAQANEAVICVRTGNMFKENAQGFYEINPDSETDYHELFQNLSRHGNLPHRIIHGWLISKDNGTDTRKESYAASQSTAFYSLLNIVKGMDTVGGSFDKQIVLLTSDLHKITGEENICADKTLVMGLFKVISQENPLISTSHIDISTRREIREADIERLIDEIRDKEAGKVVAIRNSQRWIQVFDQLKNEEDEKLNGFRHNGVYLITGGLGNLGYALSKYLLKQYEAKIVLIGRTKLAGGNGQDGDLPLAGVDGSSDEKIVRFRELKREGGEVLYFDCNISDKAEFGAIINEVARRFGEINGVIHAAGVVNGSSINTINQLNRDHFEHQFEAKILGLKVLHEMLKEKQLDFCFVISSLSSVLGGIGFGAYASANTFMDNYINIHKENGDLKNWLGINFDGFYFDQVSPDNKDLNIPEIYRVFEHLFAFKDLSQLIVSKTDLQQRLNDWVKGKPVGGYSLTETFDLERTVPEPGAGTPYEIEQTLLKLWRSFFNKQEIGLDEDFFEIGGDSLKALTMIKRMHQAFNVEVSVKDFFNSASVRKLSSYVSSVKNSVSENRQQDNYTPIPNAKENEYYQLSSAQKRLYFLYELNKKSLAYNVTQVVRLNGKVNKERLNEVFKRLVDRHESLRTSFAVMNEVPVQKIEAQVGFEMTYFRSEASQLDELIKEFIQPFDLTVAPLFRAGLIEVEHDEYVLVVDTHHIVTDGVSQSVLIRDFMTLYNDEALAPLQLQYKDYTEWQQGEEQQQRKSRQKDFWIKEFLNDPPLLNLPLNFTRPAVKSYKGGAVRFELSVEQTEGLKMLAEKEGVTMFMLLLSIYNVLLGKLSNQEDIVTGTPVAGRHHADLENVIGMFVCILPLRNYPDGNLAFREFLLAVKSNALACFDNQHYPYEELVDELKIKRDTGRNPLFDVWFVYHNFDGIRLESRDLSLSEFDFERGESKFDLSLESFESKNQILSTLVYSTDLFKQERIESFISYFKRIVSAVLANINIKIADIELVTESERLELIYGLNDTKMDYASSETVIALFEEQVRKAPENIAIQFGKETTSYNDLNIRSDRIAMYLRKVKGIQAGDLVGIMLDRSEVLISSILGILKAGAAYIPIDPVYPAERINSIVESSGLRVLIKQGQRKNLLLKAGLELVDLDEVSKEIDKQPIEHSLTVQSSKNLAYVIYTSGSTGKPKGVMIEHGSLFNYVMWAGKYYLNEEKATFPLFTSISFDLTVTSIFVPLSTGNKINIYGEDADKSIVEKVFADVENDVIKLTPSHLKIISNSELPGPNMQGHKIKKLIVGGEDFETRLAMDIYTKFNGCVEMYNEYGPTEATVGCMIYKFNPDDAVLSVPIGFPINNTGIYILDRALKPVPIGVDGELYISGDGLARGYLLNDRLTAEKFIGNPFIQDKKMYKTGDLACRLPDGNVIFKGRIDDQIKIRGFRIELGEIESLLYAYQGIKEAVVVAKEKDSGEDKFLVAYYVSEQPIEKRMLKDYLARLVPDYMLPSQYVHLEKMPLTPNGKLDKKSLPDFEVEYDYLAPSGELEESLVGIWSEILKLDKALISVNQSFFEIGGNSIRIIHLINALRKRKSVRISLKDMFEHSSIQKLARLIEGLENAKVDLIPRVGELDFYVASPAQERMYYQQLLDKNSLVHNISTALEIKGGADAGKLKTSFQKLIDRHECLRTSFLLSDTGVIQRINQKVAFELVTIAVDEFATIEEAFVNFIRPFVLSEQSLMRCGLFNRHEGGSVLFIDLHHIICDGIALNVLIKDFKAIYQGNELTPLNLRYVDYTYWQSRLLGKLEKQKEFWSKKLSGQLPRLDLPVIRDRSHADIHTAAVKTLVIKGDVYKRMKKFIATSNVSDFMFHLSINYILLSKMSGYADVIIGTDVIGRTHPEFKDIVGTFVNILPLRLQVSEDYLFNEFLSKVRECVLEAFENQDFQFDQMVSLLDKKSEMVRNPIVDFHFSFSNTVEGDELKELSFETLEIRRAEIISQYELKVEAFEEYDRLNVFFIYNNSLYSDETIEVLEDYYESIVSSVLENNLIEIRDITLESYSGKTYDLSRHLD